MSHFQINSYIVVERLIVQQFGKGGGCDQLIAWNQDGARGKQMT